jgi:4a-hydroxytetrahydrobiopterin dehydratase
MTSRTTLSFAEVEAAGLTDWRQLFAALHTRFLTGDFATGLELVNRVGALAEAADHHPDVDLRYPHVNITLCSHDVFGVTSRDVALARQISEAAADLGVKADPSTVSVVEVALDTWDHEEIKPFWRAVLGMSDSPESEEAVYDASGSLPELWFQRTTSRDDARQRFHLDVRVPHEVAESRIAAALEAGGVLVSDEFAPRFTVLADAEGNKACVTTGLGRD